MSRCVTAQPILLEGVGLGDKLRRPSRHLSGGEQQRVAIARALANDPKVILADEPTGNLDTANSERAFELLRDLVHERGKALLLATHNPAIAEACDWIHEMKDGSIIASQRRAGATRFLEDRGLPFEGDAGYFAIAIVIIRDDSRHASRNSCDTLLARNTQDLLFIGWSSSVYRSRPRDRKFRVPNPIYLAVMGVSGRASKHARGVRALLGPNHRNGQHAVYVDATAK